LEGVSHTEFDGYPEAGGSIFGYVIFLRSANILEGKRRKNVINFVRMEKKWGYLK
jgi:hypothetical protein